MIPARRRPPILLAAPSRAAGWSRATARAVLALLILTLLAAMVLGGRSVWPMADPSLAAGVADGVRHGGRYLEVAADTYRQAGYPLTVAEVPLPTAAVLTGALPALAVAALLGLSASAVLLAWWGALAGMTRHAAGPALGAVTVVIGLLGASRPGMAAMPETWAGLLIALSLARWRPGAKLEAAAFGLAAAVIAKAALLYLGVMAASEWRNARALATWLAAAAVAGAAWVAHAHALALIAGPLDGLPDVPGGGGLAAALALPGATGLGVFAPVIGLPVAVLAMVGWLGWRDARATRVLVFLAVLTVALVMSGRGDLAGWGMLGAPVALLGLIALPDLLGDLLAPALDRRRLTVTRLAR